ncbi:MAG TPA: BadF/BadG/BcrA/BcrD ATPase family protein [Gemmatimonadales bacterium]|nr:BadF/BadG/BcrA/BcrD ATPase family protein [Gemmatimonadales bacterium]
MIVLGADIGGTSMRVALYDHDTERGRAAGRGEAMRPGRGGGIAAALAAHARPLLARAGIARADCFVIGAAGAGGDAERRELEQAVASERLAWQVRVTTDAELARAAAFLGEPGVLLIAGTGSIAIALDDEGRIIRRGGLGWRMGDEGSAYQIAVAALHAVGRMHDRLGPPTHLAEHLPVAAGVVGIGSLIRWSTTATVADVAALTPAVIATADSGDEVAASIIQRGVEQLVTLAASAGAGSLPVALSGGLLAPGRPLRSRVEHLIASRLRVAISGGAIDPCRGAPVLGRERH